MRQLARIARQRPELVLAVAFGWLALILLAIFALASEVAEGELTAWDKGVLVWMRHRTGEGGPVIEALQWITRLGNASTLVIVVSLATGGLLVSRQWRQATVFLLGTTSGAAIVTAMKFVVTRPRPAIVSHLASFGGESYPSGHAANAAMVYLALAALVAQRISNRRGRIALFVAAMGLAVAIGLSRLFLGVHWPTDVLAGWAFGASWAVLCWTLGWWWDHHHLTSPTRA